jgi:dienelactone hydrolase
MKRRWHVKVTRLQLDDLGHVVPAVIFEPDSISGACPVLLAQHGGSSHKQGTDIEALVQRYLALGFAVLAVDGPVHGDRRSEHTRSASREQIRSDFFDIWRSRGNGMEAMVRSWQAAVNWLARQPHLDSEQVYWYGVSMGTAYGIPVLSQIKGIQAAVLGMWGLCFDNSAPLADLAPSIQVPVLFQIKWDDELFTRQGQMDLFERLGTTQKWLCVYPGMHVPVAGKQAEDACRFLVEQRQMKMNSEGDKNG